MSMNFIFIGLFSNGSKLKNPDAYSLRETINSLLLSNITSKYVRLLTIFLLVNAQKKSGENRPNFYLTTNFNNDIHILFPIPDRNVVAHGKGFHHQGLLQYYHLHQLICSRYLRYNNRIRGLEGKRHLNKRHRLYLLR